MTVIVKIGRRVPRNWFKRSAHKMRGLMTFQENIWIMIDRSMTLAKKKANQANTLTNFIKKTFRESENINYDLEWIEITIKGDPDQEMEEYEEAMQMYKSLGQVLKKDIETNEEMKKRFKTNRLTPKQINEAYSAGYGSMENDSIAQKLLDLGVITYIEKLENT
jgi:hypothetical protein